MLDLTGEPIPPPKGVWLATSTLTTERKFVDPHWVRKLPGEVRTPFEEDADMIFIEDPDFADAIEDEGGSSSASFSLLPHQDHFGNRNDPRGRYFSLKKRERLGKKRGGMTLAMRPAAAKLLYPLERSYFFRYRREMGRKRDYDSRFKISERQYNLCFDTKEGLDRVVRRMLPPHPTDEQLFWMEFNIMAYLIRSDYADPLMEKLVAHGGDSILMIDWTRVELMYAKTELPHGRLGPNEPALQRGFWY